MLNSLGMSDEGYVYNLIFKRECVYSISYNTDLNPQAPLLSTMINTVGIIGDTVFESLWSGGWFGKILQAVSKHP